LEKARSKETTMKKRKNHTAQEGKKVGAETNKENTTQRGGKREIIRPNGTWL